MLKRMCLFGLAGLSLLAPGAFGQTAPATQWPTQPVRMIVPFPGGASTLDAVVRLLVPEVARELASPVFVENKPGAGTVIGVDAVAKAGDRHTFGGVANSFAVNRSFKTCPTTSVKSWCQSFCWRVPQTCLRYGLICRFEI